ncbi:MAG: sugar phosphate nucleotidyltransferase [Bacteroidales bacterium]
MRAIILAGGQGTRLKPYTTLIPKPLVPIGNEMSILEIIIRQLKANGFNHITLTVNHLSNLIMAFFGNGSKWEIKLDYSLEDKPLSTIGPLTLIKDLPDNFLVMNGDILCNLNYGEFLKEHILSNNIVTVSTYKRDSKIDFGVLEYNEDRIIKGFIEKPIYSFDVSMGIYCINRSVIDNLKRSEKYGFDNLMLDGIKEKRTYKVKPFSGFWLDIGRPEDYDYCNENYIQIKKELNL